MDFPLVTMSYLLLGLLTICVPSKQIFKIVIVLEEDSIKEIGNETFWSLISAINDDDDTLHIDTLIYSGSLPEGQLSVIDDTSAVIYFPTTCKQTIKFASWTTSMNITFPAIMILLSKEICTFPASSNLILLKYPNLCRESNLTHELVSWRNESVEEMTILKDASIDINCMISLASSLSMKIRIVDINTNWAKHIVQQQGSSFRIVVFSDRYHIEGMLHEAKRNNLLRSGIHWIVFSSDPIPSIFSPFESLMKSNIAFVSPVKQIPVFYLENSIMMLKTVFIGSQNAQKNLTDLNLNQLENIPEFTIQSTCGQQHFNASSLLKIATWSRDSGLVYIRDSLFQSEFIDFGNKTLKIAAQEAKPFNIRQSLNASTKWTGFCFDILDELARGFNFNYKIVEPSDGKWGAPNGDGTWNGMVGMVYRGEVDFAVGPFTITSIRETVIDFTKPYMEDGAGILTRKPESNANKMFQMFKPFSLTVWICIGVSILVVGVLLFIANRMSPFTRYNRKEKFAPKDEIRLLSCMWLIFAFFMEQGGEPQPSAMSGRCILGFWWIFTILTMSIYTANLAAFLTVNIAEEPINSLEDLVAQTEIEPLVKRGTNLYTLFQTSETGIYQSVWNMLNGGIEIVDGATAIDMVRNGDYAYMTDNSQLQYIMLSDCETFALSKEMFNTAGYGFVLPENAPYLDHFNQKIMRMQEAGLVEKWYQKWWTSTVDNCLNIGRTSSAKTLDIDSLSGLFIVYVSIVAISLISLIIEVFVIKRRKSKETQNASEPSPDRLTELENSQSQMFTFNALMSSTI